MQNQINREMIDRKVAEIEKECIANGDECAKEHLKRFSAEAKKVVAMNIRNRTLAHECE